MDLQTRVRRILTVPREEWPVIKTESGDPAYIYTKYVLILAAIPAICMFIGWVVIGQSMPFVGRVRFGVAAGIRMAIFQYCGSLLSVYVSAFVIAKLAPTFDSRPDVNQALKLVAYSMTPMWVAGVLYLIPALGVLVILAGLYGLYLLYLGMPVLMETPEPKVVGYLVLSIVVIIVVMFIIGMIFAALGGASAMMSGSRF
jgi:hypothetical protein